ncbi:MAG: sulfatase [Planctomycetota bacterium]|nr:sulfatase [Planctomycetota bacterium]
MSACFQRTFLVLLFFSAAVLEAGDRPNFVFIVVDDVSQNDLGCYGHPTIRTPQLDRMAREGLRFENAYLTISSCSPSRCSMITGRYPHNTGACELHTNLPEGQFQYPEALRKAGYYTVLSGKNHMGPATQRAFDRISKGKGPGKEEDWVEILKNRPREKPFFCWFASTDAHRGWAVSEGVPTYQESDVVVPDYLFDGPLTRRDLADYYHEVSRIDLYVGRVLEELKRQKIERQTYVIFCADNGRPFPRCKTRLYDSGIRTPLLVWSPGTVRPAVTRSLVSSIDICATVLELSGVGVDPRVQGVSFSRILKDPAQKTRDCVFAEHNWHVFQAHERMVRMGNFVLIRNQYPDRMNMCVESAPRFPAGQELWEQREKARLSAAQSDLFRKNRPRFELYNLDTDPQQLNNLAQAPLYGEKLKQLVGLLDYWTEQTGDTVPENPTPDREDVHGKRSPGFRRGEMPGAARNATRITSPGPIKAEDAPN